MEQWNSIVCEPNLTVSVICPNVNFLIWGMTKLFKNQQQIKTFLSIIGIDRNCNHHRFKNNLNFD